MASVRSGIVSTAFAPLCSAGPHTIVIRAKRRVASMMGLGARVTYGRGALEPHPHAPSALIAEQPDRTLAEL